MHEIAKQLDLAFTRLYKEGYDVAVVRLFSCFKKGTQNFKFPPEYLYCNVCNSLRYTPTSYGGSPKQTVLDLRN